MWGCRLFSVTLVTVVTIPVDATHATCHNINMSMIDHPGVVRYRRTNGYKRSRSAYRKQLRIRAMVKLGNRCANPNCRWINDDGSIGCADLRLLQIDHVNGDGHTERARARDTLYLRVLRDTAHRYQALCCNCNYLKRCERGEIRPQSLVLPQAIVTLQ